MEFTFGSAQTLSSEISEYTHTHTGNKDSCDWLLSLLSPLSSPPNILSFSPLLLFSPPLLSSSALLEEVLAVQKDRDQAMMSRLLLANEERDEALLHARQLQQASE